MTFKLSQKQQNVELQNGNVEVSEEDRKNFEKVISSNYFTIDVRDAWRIVV